MMVARGVMDGGSVKVDVSAKSGSLPSGRQASGGKDEVEFTFDVRKGPGRVRSARARAAMRA
jgi:hypothetical protein